MSIIHTYEFVQAAQHNKLAAAEHARSVAVARARARTQALQVPVRVPRWRAHVTGWPRWRMTPRAA